VALQVGHADVKRLAQSANHLSPLDGGRHADGSQAPWDLERQRRFCGEILRKWIATGNLA